MATPQREDCPGIVQRSDQYRMSIWSTIEIEHQRSDKRTTSPVSENYERISQYYNPKCVKPMRSVAINNAAPETNGLGTNPLSLFERERESTNSPKGQSFSLPSLLGWAGECFWRETGSPSGKRVCSSMQRKGSHTTNRVQRWPRWTRYVHLYSVLTTTLWCFFVVFCFCRRFLKNKTLLFELGCGCNLQDKL
jgi:hypothetical protein